MKCIECGELRARFTCDQCKRPKHKKCGCTLEVTACRRDGSVIGFGLVRLCTDCVIDSMGLVQQKLLELTASS
jgi:hypothetical protein